MDRFIDWCNTDTARRVLFCMVIALLGLMVANCFVHTPLVAIAAVGLLVIVVLLGSAVPVKKGGWYDR